MKSPSEDNQSTVDLLNARLDTAQKMLERECLARQEVQRQLDDAQAEIAALRAHLAGVRSDSDVET